MAQIDAVPLPAPFVDLSATMTAVPAFGLSEPVSRREREFLNRLPETEQQKLLHDCTSEQQLHLRIQQAMQKQ